MQYLSDRPSVYGQVRYRDDASDVWILFDCLAANLDQGVEAARDYLSQRPELDPAKTEIRCYHLVKVNLSKGT